MTSEARGNASTASLRERIFKVRDNIKNSSLLLLELRSKSSRVNRDIIQA